MTATLAAAANASVVREGRTGGSRPHPLAERAWLGTLVADTSLSEEQARTRLVTAIDQDLSTWRDAVIAEEGS